MSTEVKRPNHNPHSKPASKTASLQTGKMYNIATEKGDQMLKTLIRKMTNVTQSKPPKDSKKKGSDSCAQNQDGKKCKSSTKSRMCFCSPTTHEGSFRCRHHRTSAPKKSVTERINFKPQLSRFGRVASAEFESHDSLIQLSRLGSS